MKPIRTAVILSCLLLAAHAGDHIYGRVQGYTSGRYLYSETGQEIGYFSGNYLYDSNTGQEIGYRSNGYLYSSRDGSVLGYCEGD